ncbi:OmpA/MotB domain protein [Parafrankia sp. Ea1.12]|uniref:OmpA family protein n=1 Tax=Parafrankia sp. Ea1.12 TaxID=573499 RepID=UPI000DA54A32|nr:OmpA family protein [Parafrankia sp. Ea1.12]SQD97515.1 OmpA/MotB domain protein [Parafrankia sp. Ea1.12]
MSGDPCDVGTRHRRAGIGSLGRTGPPDLAVPAEPVTEPGPPPAAAGPGDTARAVLVGEVVRGQAAVLARSGRYEDAARLLAELAAGRDHTAAEHDLLARIRAQQGRFDDAERHWRAALALDGNLAGAAAGLRRLERLRTRGGGIARGGAAAALLVALAFGGGWWLGHDRAEPAASTATASAPAAPAASVSAPAAPAPAPARPGDLTADLAARLAGPDVTITRAGGQAVVVFRNALFATHDTPTPEGRTALTALGARLAAAPGVAVEVVGHSDNLPVRPGGPFPDNTALSLARAASAAEILRAAGVPAAALTISAAGDALAPYAGEPAGDPTGDAAGDLRNRTVTLRVAPPA